jgi:hypothetical protein
MGHEAAAAAKAIGDRLVADNTLFSVVSTKVYTPVAQRGTAVPYVVFRQRSPGEDRQVIYPKRAMTSPLWDVGIWVEGDPHSSAAQIGADRIDVALGSLSVYSVTDAAGRTWQVSARSEGGAWVREEFDSKTSKIFYWVGRSYRLSISEA